nr:electron transfer flavoprotein subunit beta/FixA family protein [uncultured Holophaga sp.]
MKILVALKQVPDTETRFRIAPDGCSLDTADFKWITNPYDEYALEEALRIREREGAEVVAITVGPERSRELLRSALALGADRAVQVRTEDHGDPLRVARLLADHAREQAFDLILLGHKGFGGDSGAVGPMLAGLLGLPQVGLVTRLDLEDGAFTAERETDRGVETVTGRLPAVITAQRGLNEPRYPSLKGIIAAKKRSIEEEEAGDAGAGTHTTRLALPPERQEGRRLTGDSATQAATLARLLREEAKVI